MFCFHSSKTPSPSPSVGLFTKNLRRPTLPYGITKGSSEKKKKKVCSLQLNPPSLTMASQGYSSMICTLSKALSWARNPVNSLHFHSSLLLGLKERMKTLIEEDLQLMPRFFTSCSYYGMHRLDC